MSDRTKVRDLRDGDIVDLLEVYDNNPRYPLGELTVLAAQYEMTVVGGEDGPHTVESETCWVLHTEQGSFGMDPDWEFTVHGRRDGGDSV